MPPTPVVEVHQLAKTYEPAPLALRFLARSPLDRRVHALRGIDLVVQPGRICAVVGPNGAGKTTLFRILTGLTTPSAGVATVLGWDAEHHSRQVRSLIGWMPSDARSLFMRMSCRENLFFHGRLQAMSRAELRKAIPATLEAVGIGERADSTVLSLSSGMRTRLLLARALLHRPKVLILDEPTGSIDPVAAYDLLERIKDLALDHGISALVSSHRLEEIEALPDHVVLLNEGRVLFDGDLASLRRRWSPPKFELQFRSVASAEQAAGALGLARDQAGESDVLHLGATTELGAALGRLGDLAADVVTVREAPAPLRNLLAAIYAEDRTP